MATRSLRSITIYTILPLLLAAFVVGLSIFLVRGSGSARISEKQAPALSLTGSTPSKFACPVALPLAANHNEIRKIEENGQKLMSEHQFEAALTAFKDLSEQDPAFPGVNLDISMALSKLNQPQTAKQAVDAQLSISMCLAQLFPNELEPYCKAEAFASTAACMKELGSVQQGAYIQAALVQMDVDRKVKPNSVTKNYTVAHTEEQALPKILKAIRKPAAEKGTLREGKNSLASGVGTDAALGAYSK